MLDYFEKWCIVNRNIYNLVPFMSIAFKTLYWIGKNKIQRLLIQSVAKVIILFSFNMSSTGKPGFFFENYPQCIFFVI